MQLLKTNIKTIILIKSALCFFLQFHSIIYAQNDTIWLDEEFNSTQKEKFRYFRLVDSLGPAKFLIRDFYRNGVIQMEGYSEEADDKHFTGEVIRYSSVGNRQSISKHETYAEGWTTYYKGETPTSKFHFIDHCIREGENFFYDKDGKIIATITYKHNEPYTGHLALIDMATLTCTNFHTYEEGKRINLLKYFSNGQLATQAKFIPGKYAISEATYFDSTGHKIGDCHYHNQKPIRGFHVEYFNGTFQTTKPAVISFIEEYQDSVLVNRKSYNQQGILLGECEYRLGLPYQGKDLDRYTIFSYKEWKKHGSAIRYRPDLTKPLYISEYINGKLDGPTMLYYPQGDSTAAGYYMDNLPYEGFIFEGAELIQYSNGVRHGRYMRPVSDRGFEVLQYYNHGILNGPCFHIINPKLDMLEGEFRNDKPFNGYFPSKIKYFWVDYFEDGILASILEYNKDTWILEARQDLLKQTRTVFDDQGNILYTEAIRKE